MNKFKVGDLVENKLRGKGEVVRTGLHNGISFYFRVGFLNTICAVYDLELGFLEVKDKKESLLDKINQLYERQQWVKEGKPIALSYTKLPVSSAEK